MRNIGSIKVMEGESDLYVFWDIDKKKEAL